jgi:hypothetical protein
LSIPVDGRFGRLLWWREVLAVAPGATTALVVVAFLARLTDHISIVTDDAGDTDGSAAGVNVNGAWRS